MEILKRGDKGESVKVWQQALLSKGFSLTADGDFGTATEAATKSFQAKNNLRADGIVGDATRAALAGASPIPKPTQPIKSSGKKILLSAGHTNNPNGDRGAAGNNFIEGIEAVKLRDAIAANLRGRGLNIIEDGADGVSDPLKKAIALARGANLAIEFHFNAGGIGANGVEVLAKVKHKAIAQKIAGAIADATNFNLRGQRGFKLDSSGQHHRLGFCEAGGLIVEVCFISNRSEMKDYVRCFESIVENVADALAASI
jgi:N-acetylmuramoyl-L-alanine amidase